MPARYRDRLADDCDGAMVITKHLIDNCLLLFPLPAWEELETKLAGLSSTNQNNRAIKRILLGHATDVDIKNGRLMVPAFLREIVGLEKHIFLVGDGKSFQIWDETLWRTQIEEDKALLVESSLDSEQLPDLPF